jgi:CRISPR-associated Csx2 family protein
MTVQISFLGKGRHNSRTGYRSAYYRLDDKTVVETPFFGIALARYSKPSRLILLGTPGSMWDVLLEANVGNAAPEAQRLELQDRAVAESVDQVLLSRFEPLISQRLGMPCELRVISYGTNNTEQADMVARLGEWLNAEEEVVIDVTHGLRHLPMLMLVAAHYLEKVNAVKVTEIFYAALDMTPGVQGAETPVLRLSGLLRMLDWVQALAAYDKDGDYGVFSELLSGAGSNGEVGDCLRSAAFMERTSRDGQARGHIKRANGVLSQHRLTGIAELFDQPLRKRLAWADEERMFERQRELARVYLERRDFIRTSIFAFEAFITRLVAMDNGDPTKFEDRKQAKEKYDAYESEMSPDYKALRELRNALAHGIGPTRGDIQRAMSENKRLHSMLSGLIARLLGSNAA